VSTDPLGRAWRLHPQVAVRPERFGALMYHFGTRRLSFLKDPKLLAVVRSLADHADARSACASAGVSELELPPYRAALATLARSHLIEERTPA
jgi:putative mycofactocin binding protein MftB